MGQPIAGRATKATYEDVLEAAFGSRSVSLLSILSMDDDALGQFLAELRQTTENVPAGRVAIFATIEEAGSHPDEFRPWVIKHGGRVKQAAGPYDPSGRPGEMRPYFEIPEDALRAVN